MIDETLSEAHDRIRRYRQERRPEEVLDALVPALIQRLITEANALDTQDLRRVVAAQAVAYLHWYRFQALGPDQAAARQGEMMAAISCFQQLFQLDPELVPEELHQPFMAADDPSAVAEGAAAAMSDLLRLLQEAPSRDQFEKYLTMLRGTPEVCPPDHPHHPLSHAYLAIALRIKFERFHDITDLAEAVQHGRTALAAASVGHPDRPFCQSALGNALLATYQATRDDAAANEAVTVLREAVDTLPTGHPSEASLLGNLGAALAARANQGTGTDDLNEAIAFLRLALSRTTDPQLQTAIRRNLSGALTERYRRRHDPADLGEAAELTSDLPDPSTVERDNTAGLHAYLSMMMPDLAELPAERPDRADDHASLARNLLNRFLELGERRDIDGAIAHARTAVELASSARNLLLLGSALQSRFDQYSDRADLEGAVGIGRRAIEATPPGHPDRHAALSHLSVAARTKYHHGGPEDDLEEAVELGRASVDAAQEPIDQAKCKSNLGLALRTRAIVTQAVDDLDEAVTLFQAAVDALPPDHGLRAPILENLAGTLRHRAAAARQPADLDAAIERLGEALSSTPETSLRWGFYAAELSSALRQRYGDQHDPDDLELAVVLGQRSVDAPAATGAIALQRILSLARALRIRGEATRSTADLDEAIDLLRRSTQLPESAHDHAIARTELGVALWARHALNGNPKDAAEGDKILRAIVDSDLPPSIRINAATTWGEAATSQPDGAQSALDAYTYAVRLLPLSAWRGIDERSRERALSNPGLAGAAAGAAIAADRPHQALELVEQSRAVGWSQQLELRSDLTALTAAAPNTAERLAAARTAVHALDRRTTPTVREERLAVAREWDAAVAEARRLPGFAGFLQPPAAHELCRAAAGGPVVIVGIVEPRCVALIVTTDDVKTVPLPTDAAELRDRTIAFLAALHVLGGADLDLDLILFREQFLSEMLGWLWDAIAEPILDSLSIGPADDCDSIWPRLWWCPIGAMSLLPLHAAGHHARRDGSAVLDRVVSSYTPTLQTLITARERVDIDPDIDEPFLIIAPDVASGDPHLPDASAERETIRGLLGPDRCHLLVGPDATVDAVRQRLGQHRRFHLNGHGRQDLFNPSSARIDLADGGIALAEFARAERVDGDFAFLSACHTMTGGMNVPDEVMTLASAVQFAGFRHVLATLWAAPDAAAGPLCTAVYRHLIDGQQLRTERAAIALHRSIRELRKDAIDFPSIWAPFVHAGP